MMQKIIEMVMS